MFIRQRAYLQQPINALPLGMFRIGFGLIMLLELIQLRPYIVHDLLPSRYHFTYDGFSWIPVLPFDAMNVLFYLLMLLSVAVILGVFAKWGLRLLTIGYAYAFLLDVGHYNNHYYLYLLIGILLSMTNSDHVLSLRKGLNPQASLPRWQFLILQLQIAIVYFYGGIAKLEPDWIQGVQMDLWLPPEGEIPLWGAIFSRETLVSLFSLGGLALDLSAGPLLLWKPTRRFIFPVLILFHISNSLLWNIGYFPWFMILSLLLFVERPSTPEIRPLAIRGAKIAFLCLFFIFQFLFPLRRFLYSGPTSWTGQGHLFAWRMMLGDHVDRVRVFIGQEGEELTPVALEAYITRRQLQKASRTPKQYLKFAQYLAETIRQNGGTQPDVRMEVYKSLNGRPEQLLISPDKNLAQIPYPFWGNAGFLESFDSH